MLPRIAITTGDPAGIGPEICLRLAAEEAKNCQQILFGDAGVLRRVAGELHLDVPKSVVEATRGLAAIDSSHETCVFDLAAIEAEEIVPGQISRAAGLASYAYIDAAIDAALAGEVDAIVTGPIHKEALHAAQVPYPGHTEILAARTASDRVCMMLTSRDITCSLVTTHVGLGEVAGLLTTARVYDVIELSDAAIRRIRGRAGKLVVCGLNPHAGEHGLFGSGEEERLIRPAVDAAREKGIDVEGPVSPDAAFLPDRRRNTDGYICMYHDQGLIPLKALSFDTAVNVTLGLPIVRTSVDHGTAFDIAWQGRADATSLRHAVDLAVKLVSP